MGAVEEGVHVTEMVKKALGMGYRHIDTVGNNAPTACACEPKLAH